MEVLSAGAVQAVVFECDEAVKNWSRELLYIIIREGNS